MVRRHLDNSKRGDGKKMKGEIFALTAGIEDKELYPHMQ
jgi:hypothetical protein